MAFDRSPPVSSNSFTVPSCPFCAALSNGVRPLVSIRLISAPSWIDARAIVSFPYSAAHSSVEFADIVENDVDIGMAFRRAKLALV